MTEKGPDASTAGASGTGGAPAAGGAGAAGTQAGGSKAEGGAAGSGGLSAGGTSAGTAGSGGSSGSAGQTCTGDEGAPACTNPFGPCDRYCQDALTYLKPGVAAKGIECFGSLAAPTATYCSGGPGCLQDALGKACPDASADDDCAALDTACGTSDTAACHKLLDGLNEAARTEAVACTKADCAGGLQKCVRALLSK